MTINLQGLGPFHLYFSVMLRIEPALTMQNTRSDTRSDPTSIVMPDPPSMLVGLVGDPNFLVLGRDFGWRRDGNS